MGDEIKGFGFKFLPGEFSGYWINHRKFLLPSGDQESIGPCKCVGHLGFRSAYSSIDANVRRPAEDGVMRPPTDVEKARGTQKVSK